MTAATEWRHTYLEMFGEEPHRIGLAEYGAWMQANGWSARTIEARMKFARVAQATWTFKDVTTGELKAWLNQPSFSSWTRCTYHGHMQALFTWLLETDQIDVNPCVGIPRPRPPKASPRPLSDSQVQRVLDACSGDARTWLHFALFAGLRAHEIAKLRGEDVTSECIYVDGKGGKRAMIPTHPTLWTLAQGYPERGYWFPVKGRGGHVSWNGVSSTISRLFTELGIEGGIHRGRHTYATRLLRAGVNIRVVQTLMRHSSMSTTAAYLQVEDDELRRGIGMLS